METDRGILLTPYDPEAERALKVAARAAKKYRNALRELARQPVAKRPTERRWLSRVVVDAIHTWPWLTGAFRRTDSPIGSASTWQRRGDSRAALGTIAFPVPLLGTFKLGIAGGSLIAALVLGWLGRTGPLTWTMPLSANLTLRNCAWKSVTR